MAFEEVTSLNCEVTTALGGVNRQTGKPNPTKAEGYYLGSKEVESRKSKNGKAKLHIFLTPNGNLGVWGKTDLDRKMASVTPGAMVRVTQNGKTPTPNGDMYKFKVEVDRENTMDVSGLTDAAPVQESASYDEGEESGLLEDEQPSDEISTYRAPAPRQVASTPDAARQAKVKALLSANRNKTS